MKQKHLNLALGVLALGLLGAVVFSKKHDADKEKGTPLTALKESEITKIAIRHPDAAEIDLEKKGGQWMLIAPVQAIADPFELTALTGLATTESHSSIDADQVKKADLGLDPPAYSIQLNDTKIDFGGLEPIKNQRYVQSGSGKIELIDDPASSALDADYSDLVAKEVLPPNGEIAKIEVPGLTVERSPAGPGWTSVPVSAAATSDAVQKLVDGWRAARSTWNTASDKAKPRAPDAPPLETATVTLKDGTTIPFVIASRDPQLVLERPDLKVRLNLPKTEIDKLLKLPEPKPVKDAKPSATDSLLPKLPGSGAPALPDVASPDPAPAAPAPKS